jgi:hypothetical protein
MAAERQLTIQDLVRRAVPPAVVFHSLLERPKFKEELDKLSNELDFEYSTYALYGKTKEDEELHRRFVEPLLKRKRQIHATAMCFIFQGLTGEHLYALGLRTPLTETSMHEVIAPVLWNVLGIDILAGLAEGQDRKYVDVRLLIPADCSDSELKLLDELLNRITAEPPRPGPPPSESLGTLETSASSAGEKVGSEEAEALIGSPSFPGRPSLIRRVQRLMEERAQRGELADTITVESNALEVLIAHEFPDVQTPTAKTIRNALRSKYRELKARYTSPE